MFYDSILKKSSKLGEKMVKIISESRDKIYTKRVRNLETGEIEVVETGRGTEIVKELNTTEAGYKIWLEEHPLPLSIDKEVASE